MISPRSSPEPAHKRPFFYGYIIVISSFIIMSTMWGAMQSFGVFLKPMSEEFAWTRGETSAAFSLTMFVLGFLFIIAGRLNDRFGPRVLNMVCGFSLGLGFFLMSTIDALWQLYLIYGVMVAIGVSGGLVPLSSTVARWFIKKRGLMTAIVISGVGAGATIGPPVTSTLLSSYGWRTSYVILGIAVAAIIIISAQFLRRDPAQKGQRQYGESKVDVKLLEFESKGVPLPEAIKTGAFWMLLFAYMCFGFGTAAIMTHVIPHATDAGLSNINAANIIAIAGGVSIAGRIGFGSAGDRIGNKRAFAISLAFLSASFAILLFARELAMLRLFGIIFGIGYGGAPVLMSPIIAEMFGLKAHGAIMGMASFGLTIGSAIGPYVTGHMYDTAGTYFRAFVIATALSGAALVLVSLLKPARKFQP